MSMQPQTLPVRPGLGRWMELLPWAALLILGSLSPIIFDKPHWQGTLFQTFLLAGLACAWNILGGYAGQLSLGHAAFYGLGAYTSVLLAVRLELTPWLGMWVGVLIAAVLGAALGVICFRLKGPFFALATLALGELVFIGAANWRSLTGGNEGLVVPLKNGFMWMGFRGKAPYVFMAFGFLVLVMLISALVKRSRLGYFLAAYREDDAAAQSLGINTYAARLAASAISSGLMAIGGTLYAYYVLFIEPNSVLSTQVSIQIPLIALVGGIGTVFGPMLGAVLILPLTNLLRANLGTRFAGLHWVIYGVLLITVLLYMPDGLLGRLQQAGRWVARRLQGGGAR